MQWRIREIHAVRPGRHQRKEGHTKARREEGQKFSEKGERFPLFISLNFRWLEPLTTEVARHLLKPVAYAPVIIVPPKCRT